MLVVVALASLLIAEWGVREHPSTSFYLLPARAWELLLGSLVAVHLTRAQMTQPAPWRMQLGSGVGLLLILVAAFLFDERTPFPGVYALVPAVGTALVILYATPQTAVGKLLGHRGLVAVGLISYSAYLWHQPLFAFVRHRSLEHPDPAMYGLLSVVALGLAYLSWRFVEVPFRDKTRIGRKGVFSFAAVAVALPLTVGMLGYLSDGFFFRDELRARMGDVDARLTGNFGLNEVCEGDFTLSPMCRTSDAPEILLWGDSYAMHLAQGISASNKNARLIQMTMSVCGPFLGVAPTNEKYPARWASKCIQFNDKVIDWLRSNKSVKYVVLSSPFRTYMADGIKVMLRNGEVVAGASVALPHFRETLRRLRELGVTPVVVSTTPQSGEDLGRCLAKMVFLNLTPEGCSFDRAFADARQKSVLDFLREVERDAKVIWLADSICPKGQCNAGVGNVMVYRDSGHLSREGSAFVGRQMNLYQAIASAR